jgi:hypothetical protein
LSAGDKRFIGFAEIHDGLLSHPEVIAEHIILLPCKITAVFCGRRPPETVYYRAVDGSRRLELPNFIEIQF